MTDWDLFVTELVAHFGAANPSADARRELDNLRMKSDQRIRVYDVEFHRLGALALYDEVALLHRYYSGLPDRIKDTLALLPPSPNLVSLRTTAQNIDNRYWERQAEKKSSGAGAGAGGASDNPSGGRGGSGRRNRNNTNNNSGQGSGNSGNKTGEQSPSDSRNQNRHQRGRGNGSGSGSGSGSGGRQERNPNRNPNRDPPNPKSYEKNLGPDGKLKPEIRQHRIANKLCLICGKSGHFTDTCPDRRMTGRGAKTKGNRTPPAGDATPPAASATPSATITEVTSTSSASPAKN